jgi:hypothetical protein
MVLSLSPGRSTRRSPGLGRVQRREVAVGVAADPRSGQRPYPGLPGRRLGAAHRRSAANGTAEVIASHALFLDGVRRWVSLISIAFEPIQDATRITHTEQYTFLAWADDGTHDQAHLRGSTQLAFNALAALVELATWNSRENGLALVGLLTPTLTGTGTEAPKVHTPSATVNRVRLGGAASTEPSFEAPSAVARHLR